MIIIPDRERIAFERYLLAEYTNMRKFGIIIAMYTGMRIGELCALRWNDIDIKNGLLYVKHTIQRMHDYSDNSANKSKTKLVIDTPKTISSVRTIPLTSYLIDKLSFLSVSASGENYVLTGTNKPEEPRSYLYFYKKQLQACDLPEYTFHTLRHTFATRCVEQGFDIKSLSEILGHSNVKITMDRYVHPSMDTKRRQMERLEVCV